MGEILDIVNERDIIIDSADRSEFIKKRHLHRSVIIFLFNPKNEIFIHKRPADKAIYPNMYDLSIGGAVLSGETYHKAAVRETREEVGVINPKLKFLFKERYKSRLDNTFVAVYKINYGGKLALQKDEIKEGKFFPITKLKELVKKKRFCPEVITYFNRLQKLTQKKKVL